jgi:Ni/Co efflux regulator RcnB
MKSLISAVVVATVLAAPVAAFAQSNQPVTRAQVVAELAQLEKAGYNPAADRYDYPVNIQAAEARVNAQNGAANTSGYGAASAGSSQGGQ